MRKVHRFGMIAVLAIGTVSAPAFAGNVTVGRFYSELAQAKQLVSVDAASAEANLRGAGFNLPNLALDGSLTEGDMASISNALGVAVTTQRPGQVIDESQLNTFMSVFGNQLGKTAGAITGGADDPTLDGHSHHGHGHHHHHGHDHHHSRSEP